MYTTIRSKNVSTTFISHSISTATFNSIRSLSTDSTKRCIFNACEVKTRPVSKRDANHNFAITFLCSLRQVSRCDGKMTPQSSSDALARKCKPPERMVWRRHPKRNIPSATCRELSTKFKTPFASRFIPSSLCEMT